MNTIFRTSALALAAAGMAFSVMPAEAASYGHAASAYEQVAQHGRGDRGHRDRDRDRYGYDTRYYGPAYHSEPVRRDTRVWRANDGRTYCRKKDGTTGLIVGAAAGALLGRSVDTRGDRTLGTIIGGALGALVGRSVGRGTTCR